MENINRIIIVEKIARLIDQLYSDPTTGLRRQLLHAMLFEEESRYGVHSSHLEIAMQHIDRFRHQLLNALDRGDNQLSMAAQDIQADRHSAAVQQIAPAIGVEQSSRLILECAPTAMLLVGRSGVVVMVNAEAERIFGYSRIELLGRSVEILIPERFRAPHAGVRAGYFDELSARQMGAGRDLYALRKDGGEFPVEIGLNPIETSDGTLVLASVIDITARKAAELALRQTEHRARALAAIVEFSGDAIISLGLDGQIESWNRAAERMFGYAEAEMLGQPILKLAAPGHEAEMMDILDRVRVGERVNHYETLRRHKDGSLLHVSLTESPVYDADGQLGGASKVLRDITSAKAAEAALQQSQERLQELHSEILQVSRLSAMGQMTAGMAHELNQPLTAISNYMAAGNAVLDRGGDLSVERLRSVMQRAGEQTVRAGQIIQRLRDLVIRGDTKKQIEALPPLIREARELALIGMSENGVSIRLGDDLPEVAVIVDKMQVQQVLLNLLRNAAEAVAGQDDRDITLLAGEHGGMVEIAVVDNGPGIAEEIRERLFQPFATTKTTGMGLGLAICHSIIASHNGRLWAEPNPAGGTIFRVALPIASATEAGDL